MRIPERFLFGKKTLDLLINTILLQMNLRLVPNMNEKVLFETLQAQLSVTFPLL